MKVRNLLAPALLATALLLGPGMASALTVIENAGIASEILDLPVDGTLYNVVFLADEFADRLYAGTGGTLDFDFDNATDASAAVDAIVAALNGAGVNGVGPDDNMTAPDNEFRIGFMSLGSDVRTQVGANLSTSFTNEGTEIAGGGFRATYADFTVVPEPTTGLLLGMGLCGLGLIGRRRRQ